MANDITLHPNYCYLSDSVILPQKKTMTTQQTDWIEYTGSDKQIDEIRAAKNGWIARTGEGHESIILDQDKPIEGINSICEYWIIPADPLREMKIRQAMTGQPVWVSVHGVVHQTTNPNWNWANAEYSFTPFEDDQLLSMYKIEGASNPLPIEY